MKYANYDNDGNILGFYSDDIHSIIPEPNIALTDDQWQSALNGSKIVDVENMILIDKPIQLPTLAQLANSKDEEDYTSQQDKINNGSVIDGVTYDINSEAKSNINLIINCLNMGKAIDVETMQIVDYTDGQTFNYYDYHGQPVPLTKEQFLNIAPQILLKTAILYGKRYQNQNILYSDYANKVLQQGLTAEIIASVDTDYSQI